MEKKYNIYTDGGARGNPGPAGCGIVIEECTEKECNIIVKKHRFIGKQTNNVAEYTAINIALEEIKKLGLAKEFNFHLDSQLVVEQLKGNYKVKHPNLLLLYQNAKNELDKLSGKINYIYIPREKNKLADKLANQAMDEGISALKE